MQLVNTLTTRNRQLPFETYIKSLRENGKKAKHTFLSLIPPLHEKNIDEYPIYIFMLIQNYRSLCFFPDSEIISQFKKWGFPAPKLNWMIPIDNLIKEMDDIEKSGEIILKRNMALIAIEQYLGNKIFNDVYSWGQKTGKRKMKFNLRRYFENFFRRLIYGNGHLIKPRNREEVSLERIIRKLNKDFPTIKETRKYLIESVAGKTENKQLKYLIEECHTKLKPISQRRLFCLYFSLFRLICKNKSYRSEKEFDIWVRYKSRSNQAPYDGDYDDYRYKKIRKLVYNK